jgi:hypothetical protein
MVFVAAAAIVAGGLTSPGQQYLPDAVRSLANAAGPWFVVVFAAVWFARAPLVLAVILGVSGFVLLNASYGVVSSLRGFPYSAANIWTAVAIPAGVAVGVAVTWLRSGRKSLVAMGAALPAIVLLGEGVYGLTTVLATTGPVVWILELVCGAAWSVWVAARRLRPGAPA